MIVVEVEDKVRVSGSGGGRGQSESKCKCEGDIVRLSSIAYEEHNNKVDTNTKTKIFQAKKMHVKIITDECKKRYVL